MDNENARAKRRGTVVINYLCLVMMNVCYYFVWAYKDMTHVVDVVGIGALVVVGITFIRAHWKTGLWRLTHAKADALDERQLQITHTALSRSYAWFAVICLVIMLTHAVVYRLVPGLDFALSVPLVVSLIYLAHTLPGSVLAWTETEVPGKV
ncbi:MAG: hypothetical protein ACYTKC_01880 [Planctomycetota bacterium]